MVRWREASFVLADAGVGGMLEAWTDISSGWIWAGVTAVGVAGLLLTARKSPGGAWRRVKRAVVRRFRNRARGDYIPLADAVVRAWNIEGIRDLPEFQTAPRERPQDIYRRLAESIFDGGDPSLSIRGVIGELPLDQIVESPHEYTFANDLTEMTHVADEGRCYRDLWVSWPDVEATIRRKMEET